MRLTVFLVLFSATQLLWAQKAQVFQNSKGAIRGYDPVAYFTQEKAVPGNKDISYEWHDAEWRFSSEENKKLFVANPEKYAPQYGGYCAYAVGNNYTASTAPEAWHIRDGKLYLNYSKGVQKKWQANIDNYIKQGDANWPAVLNK